MSSVYASLVSSWIDGETDRESERGKSGEKKVYERYNDILLDKGLVSL